MKQSFYNDKIKKGSNKMREVTGDEFFEVIGPLNVTLTVLDPYPYKTEFKLKYNHQLVGYQDHDGKYYLI